MKKLCSLIFISLALACSHAQKVSDVNFLLVDIQKAVGETLPAGIFSISENRREYTSNYFFNDQSEKQPESRPAKKQTGERKSRSTEDEKPRRRYKALVVILGDERPYSYEVTAYKQTLNRSSGEYEDDGIDQRLALRIANAIQEYLVKRLKSKNFIDDFRPF